MSGTIVLERADGSRTVPKAGSIRFHDSNRYAGPSVARVENGAYTLLTSRPDTHVDIGEVELDGVACWVLAPWTGVSAPRTADLVAHPILPATLHVVDGDTGDDLESVDLIRADGSAGERHELALPSCPSPIAIPQFRDRGSKPYGWIGMRPYRVASPGYATQQVWIDPSEGGTRAFALEPEARVRLSISSAEPIGSDVRAWVTRAGVEWVPREFVPSSGVLEIGGLDRGSWTVHVQRGQSDTERAFADFELSKAGRAEVQLVLPPYRDLFGDDPPRTPTPMHRLRGTIYFPDGVVRPLPALVFELRSAGGPGAAVRIDVPSKTYARDPGRERSWFWHGGPAAKGRWRVSIPDMDWAQDFEVTGDTDLALVVSGGSTVGATAVAVDPGRVAPDVGLSTGPRSELLFVLVDAETGDSVGAEEARPTASGRPVEQRWSPTLDRDVWFASAKGTLQIMVDSRLYHAGPYTLNPTNAGMVIRVPVARRCWFHIRAYDGDARIGAPEIDEIMRPIVQRIGDARDLGPGVVASILRENVYACEVPGSGRYRVTLRDNARYAPHSPVEIDVMVGGPAPVVEFRLTPTH